jgi:hypothetical protein
MVGDHDLIDYLLEIFDAEGDTDGRRFLHLLMRRKVKSREYKLARDELSAVLKEQGGFTVKLWGSVREIAAKMEESLGLDAGELLLPAAFCNDAEFDNYDADQSVHVHTDPSGSKSVSVFKSPVCAVQIQFAAKHRRKILEDNMTNKKWSWDVRLENAATPRVRDAQGPQIRRVGGDVTDTNFIVGDKVEVFISSGGVLEGAGRIGGVLAGGRWVEGTVRRCNLCGGTIGLVSLWDAQRRKQAGRRHGKGGEWSDWSIGFDEYGLLSGTLNFIQQLMLTDTGDDLKHMQAHWFSRRTGLNGSGDEPSAWAQFEAMLDAGVDVDRCDSDIASDDDDSDDDATRADDSSSDSDVGGTQKRKRAPREHCKRKTPRTRTMHIDVVYRGNSLDGKALANGLGMSNSSKRDSYFSHAERRVMRTPIAFNRARPMEESDVVTEGGVQEGGRGGQKGGVGEEGEAGGKEEEAGEEEEEEEKEEYVTYVRAFCT